MVQRTSEASPSISTFSLPFFAILTLLVLLFGASVYAHRAMAAVGDDYTGALALFDRLFDIFLASGLISLAFCCGRKTLRAASVTFAGNAEEVAFSVFLGTGLVALAILGFGLAGLLTPLPIAALLVVFLMLSYREIGRGLQLIREASRFMLTTKSRLLVALLFGILFGILLLRTLTPPHAFDDAIYHLSATQAFVQKGRVYPLLDNSAGNMSFLIQMFYAVCLLAKADIAAKLICLFLAFTCSLSLYSFGARFFSRRTGALAALVFFAAGMVTEVAVTSRIDVSLAALLWASTYALILFFHTREQGWLYLSALFAGFALGVKYTAGLWLLLLGFMFLIESLLKRDSSILKILQRGLLYSLMVVAVASPWFVKNWFWFHNPVYPFMTGEVADYTTGAPRYFTPEDDAKLEAHFANASRNNPSLVEARKQELEKAIAGRVIQRPPHLWEYFTKSDIYNFPEEHHDPNYLFLLLPLLIFLPKQRWISWLAALSVVFYILMTQVSWFPRYLLPLYPPLTVISAYVLGELIRLVSQFIPETRRAIFARSLLFSGLIALMLAAVWVSARQISKENILAFVGGNLSRRNFMLASFYYPPLDFINRTLPENARVMMLGAQMSYGLKRDHIADISLDSTEWRRLLIRNRTLADVHNDLKRQGITHILVSYGVFTWGAMRSGQGSVESYSSLPGNRPDYYVQLRNWATLDQYSSSFLEPVYSDQFGFMLYRLR